MKYKITPLNIFCVISLVIAIYFIIKPGTWGFGYIVGIYLLPLIALILGFDYLLQNKFRNYLKLIIVESLILGLLYFCYLFTERTKTYIIPESFEDKYIVTIYDYPNSPRLPNGWNYIVKIPSNGILLTSSPKYSDLRMTNFITSSGTELNTIKTDLGFGEILNDKINCNGRLYEFTVWKVQNFCCGYSTDETQLLKQNLQKQICK